MVLKNVVIRVDRPCLLNVCAHKHTHIKPIAVLFDEARDMARVRGWLPCWVEVVTKSAVHRAFVTASGVQAHSHFAPDWWRQSRPSRNRRS